VASVSPEPSSHNVEPDRTLPWQVLLAGIVLVVYAGSFAGGFLFDDGNNIVDSPRIRRLWPLGDVLRSNRPLGDYTFSLGFAVHGLDPWGFHVVNVAIHLVAAQVLFGLIRQTLLLPGQAGAILPRKATGIAFVAALIWAVHPLTTQAVTYIVQRFESLAALATLVCLYAVVRGSTSRRPMAWDALAVFAAWAGFLTKETGAMIPVLVVLFDLVFLRPSKVGVRPVPWWLYLGLCSPLIWFVPRVSLFFTGKSASMGLAYQKVSPVEYVMTQPEVLLHYLKLSFWPAHLCFDYRWPVQQDWRVSALCGLVIVGLLIGTAWLLWRREPAGFVCAAFFVILAPTSSFVPVADLAAEHRMYLPLACVVTLSVLTLRWCAVWTTRRWPATAPAVNATLVVLALLVPLALSARTMRRNQDYRSAIAMWRSVLETRPHNPRAWYGLGKAWHDAGQYDEALAVFRKAAANGMDTPALRIAIADCENRFGRHEVAERLCRDVLTRYPDLKIAHITLATILYQQNQFDGALEHFQAAAGNPRLIEARVGAASSLANLGRHSEAIEELTAALDIRPDHKPSAILLAWLLSTSPADELRDGPRAVQLLTQVCRVQDSRSFRTWDAYAAALAETGEYESAVAAAKQALELAAGIDDVERREQLERRLSAYESGRPWRSEQTLDQAQLRPIDRARSVACRWSYPCRQGRPG